MYPFQDNSNMIISGCSGSGKTVFVSRLIKYHKCMFHTPPEVILFIYKHWQDLYARLEDSLENVRFQTNMPTEDELTDLTRDKKHSLLICDDMMSDIASNSFMRDVFTRLSHHLRMSTILLLQNMTNPGKHHSTLCTNVHVSVLMKSPREAFTLRTLGMQLGDYKNLKCAYEDATQDPYSYLVCDTHPNGNSKFKYRTKIFPDDTDGVVTYISGE